MKSNQVRIIGGDWRSRRIGFPDHEGLRPSADRVRETLFNWLGQDLHGQTCLDLFAGSGALGIEALSRGAASCAFVENERAALSALRGNLARLGEHPGGPSGVRVVASDVRRALQADARRGARYTLLFADPPYDRYADVRPALVRLLEPLLATGAVLVVETAAGTEAALPWTTVREKRYGDTRVTFLVTGDEQSAGGSTRENDAETG
jgi:16S rRNA (guanine966-N2)-methyltransferase